MAIDEQTHVALPKLRGAPAYARPPRLVADTPRPFDPDDLPIEAFRTDDEREVATALPGSRYAGSGDAGTRDDGGSPEPHRLQPRPFRLRNLARRLLDTGS